MATDGSRTEAGLRDVLEAEPGGSSAPSPQIVRIDVPSRFDLVTVVRMVVAACSSATGVLSGDRLDDLRWVISEATTNAIQANQLSEAPGRVTIECELTADTVQLRVSDEGPGMPPETLLPDMTSPDRLDIEGGFGIPLMRTLSNSDLRFTSDETGTTVEMELSQVSPQQGNEHSG